MTARRHRLAVEVTDTTGRFSTRDMTHVIRKAIEQGGPASSRGRYANLRVKSFARVLGYERRLWGRKQDLGHWTVKDGAAKDSALNRALDEAAALARSNESLKKDMLADHSWRGVGRTILFLVSGGRW